MSEVQSRPTAPRGRGSSRGGRGGYAARGGRGGRAHNTNGDNATSSLSIEDDSEVGQLKKLYGSKVSTIKEMFPDWTDEDIVFALQETDGDLETTVERISDGSVSQWGEVSKTKKDRSRSKVKDATITTFGDMTNQGKPSRGGRGGIEGSRGARGRGTDRGRGGRARGSSAAQTNGSRNKENVDASPAAPGTSAWDNTDVEKDEQDAAKPADDSWSATATATAAAATATAAKVTSSIIPDGVKKSWASMFQSTPAPKKAQAPVEKPAETHKHEEITETSKNEPEAAEPAPIEPVGTPDVKADEEPDVVVTPSKDELTEGNLEQVLDVSHPPLTATAASTAASSWDPRNNAGTPLSAQQAPPQAIRPPTSGFQASALKATGSSRTPSYQRRILDQEEAVRMPGNREVDRAAVQFGAFNLNGLGEEDVDGDREEPETRAQPPQHSPVAHPRATLPPAPQQASAAVPETAPTPKQPAGLPAPSQQSAAMGLPAPQSLPSAHNTTQQGGQGNTQASQYGRYAQSGSQEQSSLPQKPYDTFSQQPQSTQSPFEGYQSQQSQAQSQPQSSAFSSAPTDYSQYYTADQQRNAYNSYYGQQYGLQQGAQGQQEPPSSQQRSYSGYNAAQADTSSQFPQSAAQPAQSRYTTAGENQNSGHTTPNPVAQGQQTGTTQGAQPQSAHPQQAGAYPYGHPYYSSPYYAQYMNQYQQYGGGSYGGARSGIHAQPYQGYGMTPVAPYDHAASPAAGGFGATGVHGRDSTLGAGLGDYGRAGSAQSSQNPQGLGGSGTFGGTHDTFGRGNSYQGQGQQHYGQQSGQPGAGDDLKPFGDSKSANGPSPSLAQAGRPGSATNTGSGSALPPPQSQPGYGGYPAHLQQGHGLHGNQAGGYGGLGQTGSHQAAGQGHQGSQYGGYQGFGGNNYYGNSQQRGGWGGNYSH